MVKKEKQMKQRKKQLSKKMNKKYILSRRNAGFK